MWTIEELEKKVANITQQIEQSLANHHILIGSKLTLEGLLLEAKKAKSNDTVETVSET